MYFSNNKKYEIIIELICKYKAVSKKELISILKDDDCGYLLFLLLRKYNCIDLKLLKRDFNIENKKELYIYIEKAEKELLTNKKIRNMFFEAEDIIDNIK
ncbi:hypothetical protein [Clostridium oceanicum]|uniref:Ribose 5-phosphate isomerase n=1 Tax=Clostridium oceanicum TaxID=1543 RepID=A0ABN1JPQ7_9CLOT